MKKIQLRGAIFSLLFCVVALHVFGASVEPVRFKGWDGALRVTNQAVEIVVVPRIGRLVHFGPVEGENLLSFNEALAGQTPSEEEGDWVNHGGDWLWPVHQGRWDDMGGSFWPPLRLMEGPAWEGRAWIEEDGTGVIRMSRSYGAPLFLEVERVFILPPGDRAEMRVEQSVRRTGESDIPACLWHISQIAGAEQAIMGVTDDSPFENGYKVIAFDPPPEKALTPCEQAVVYHAGIGGENKLGADAGWIAARRGDHLIVQWAEGDGSEGAYPDGGCRVVLYSNKGLGYTEIETQSVEKNLAQGEVLRNTVVTRLLQVPSDLPACEAVERIRALPPEKRVIRFSPQPAHPDDRIRVHVRTDEPGGILHWGVNGPDGGWELPAPVYRPDGSSVGTTGVAVDTPLPPPIQGESTLVLGPFNDPEQVVSSLHAVARWGDHWESRGGKNYNLELTTHPEASRIRWVGDVSGGVEVITEPAADELRLYRNGQEIAHVEKGTLRHGLNRDSWPYGPHDLRVRALRDGKLSTSTRRVWKTPRLEPRMELPADTPYGFSMGAEGAGRIVVHAPNARFVELEWRWMDEPDTDARRTLMRPVDGGRWTAELPPLKDRKLAYRYLVEGEGRFADPWSVDVEWTTPNGAYSHVPEHAWSLVGTLPPPLPPWEPPPMERWVIYELSIPDVAPPGSFEGLREKLGYIEDLGVNVIEPLPVTTFPGDVSWGYNPAFHMAPERSYGTPGEFADLLKAARERNIAFIVDIVLNHVAETGPLSRMHGDPEQSPYTRPFASFNWGFPKLDQESEAYKRYVKDTLTHWVRQWGVDGFRYDATQWIQWSGYKEWGASWMSYVVDQANADVVQIAENIPGEPDMVKGTELDAEWDAHFCWRIRHLFLDARIKEPAKLREVLDPRNHAYQTGWQRMLYVESHDEERLMHELLNAGYGETEALRRHHAAAAVTLTAPGIPMVYAGQEWGEQTLKFVGPNPLNWAVREQPARAALWDRFQELIRLRTSHRALHHDKVEIVHLDPKTGSVAYLRPGVPESVLTTFNASRHPIVLDLREAGVPVSELHTEEAPETLAAVPLQPGEARVFIVRRP